MTIYRRFDRTRNEADRYGAVRLSALRGSAARCGYRATRCGERRRSGLRGKELRGNAPRGNELRGNGTQPIQQALPVAITANSAESTEDSNVRSYCCSHCTDNSNGVTTSDQVGSWMSRCKPQSRRLEYISTDYRPILGGQR